MGIKYYCIINIKIGISDVWVNNDWKLFEIKTSAVQTIDFRISGIKANVVHGMECFEIKDQLYHVCRVETEVMLADKEWKDIIILPPYNYNFITSFFLQIFYTHAVKKQVLQMHSSLIKIYNYGIMFLGPSGIGKTTQAELWNKYREALIINGDITFVQEMKGEFYGWGTPWHGSSPYCANTSVLLKAMIVLKQAPENSIRELTGFEKVTAVSNSVFYPRWLENGMELCLETLDHLLTKIPVYELSCRPDEDAVKLTEETVFGSN